MCQSLQSTASPVIDADNAPGQHALRPEPASYRHLHQVCTSVLEDTNISAADGLPCRPDQLSARILQSYRMFSCSSSYGANHMHVDAALPPMQLGLGVPPAEHHPDCKCPFTYCAAAWLLNVGASCTRVQSWGPAGLTTQNITQVTQQPLVSACLLSSKHICALVLRGMLACCRSCLCNMAAPSFMNTVLRSSHSGAS